MLREVFISRWGVLVQMFLPGAVTLTADTERRAPFAERALRFPIPPAPDPHPMSTIISMLTNVRASPIASS